MSELKLETIEITVEDVCKRLALLRKDKSPGADDMSPRLLKTISTEIAEPVTANFNESFSKGIVPMDWKIANITPIYKKGSRKSAVNYRPVSLTSHLSKLMEAILRDKITEHLEEHQLIRESQHGFRRGSSCTTNLLAFLDEPSTILDNGEKCDAIFLDFAKAFDKVPHHRILVKLAAHVIEGRVVNWIKSWLSGRMQRV